MRTFEVFCSLFVVIGFFFMLASGFILESRITVGVFFSSWSVVSIVLMEARSLVVSGVRIQFKLSSTRG